MVKMTKLHWGCTANEAASSRQKACPWCRRHVCRSKAGVVLSICFQYDVMAAFLCVIFPSGHSLGRSFTMIFLKIADEVESYLPLFAIKNQRDRSVTSANTADRVFE